MRIFIDKYFQSATSIPLFICAYSDFVCALCIDCFIIMINVFQEKIVHILSSMCTQILGNEWRDFEQVPVCRIHLSNLSTAKKKQKNLAIKSSPFHWVANLATIKF